MTTYYIKQLAILGCAYIAFFILAYTPLGWVLAGQSMPYWLLEIKLIVIVLLGLYLIIRSVLKMRNKGKELGKMSWPYSLLTVAIGVLLLMMTSTFSYLLGFSY